MAMKRILEAQVLSPRSRHHKVEILMEHENTSFGYWCSPSPLHQWTATVLLLSTRSLL